MKNFKNFYVGFVICLALSFVSCSDKDDNDNDNTNYPSNDGVFTATVTEANTPSFQSNFGKAVWTKDYLGASNTFTLYLEGKQNSLDRQISIYLHSTVLHTPGTYELSLLSAQLAYFYEDFDQTTPKAWVCPFYGATDLNLSYGTVNLTSINDTRAIGTFSFTSYEEFPGTSLRTVTNGSFNLPVTKQGF
jgi:hypothetical protein